MSNNEIYLVIGAGPSGYAAAFRLADLGKNVVLVDREDTPGGVCLHRGCIPSKTLLHISQVVRDATDITKSGILFETPGIDIDKLRSFREEVIRQGKKGLKGLTERRRIQFIQGNAVFLDGHTVKITKPDETSESISFHKAVLAVGSKPRPLPGLDNSLPGILDSSSALAFQKIPESLLVVGGGYIGLELGTFYSALGSRVSVTEMEDRILPLVERDLVLPLQRSLENIFENVLCSSRVSSIENDGERLRVTWSDSSGEAREECFENVLISIGREPLTGGVGLDRAGVEKLPSGFIQLDTNSRTTNPDIYAIGDIAGEPMLAHKATYEGKKAADILVGREKPPGTNSPVIPAVIFTDPEIAWAGLTLKSAREVCKNVKTLRFPWSASGRAGSMGCNNGLTRLIVDDSDGRILGAGVTGRGAGEMISALVIAMERGMKADELSNMVFPHPTLSETWKECAEIFTGECLHLYRPLRNK